MIEMFHCRSRFASLNKHHAYFLLVDNGTVAKYGAEIALRRKLEKFISTQSINNQNLDFSAVCSSKYADSNIREQEKTSQEL